MKERTEKMQSLIVATQSLPNHGMSKERKHFLPKYFPVIEKKYAIVWQKIL